MVAPTLLIVGHPFPDHLCHAIAERYRAGAELARLDPTIAALIARVRRAEHLVLVHPVWVRSLAAFGVEGRVRRSGPDGAIGPRRRVRRAP